MKGTSEMTTTTTYNPTLSDIRQALEGAQVEELGPGMERSDMLRAVKALEAFAVELAEWVACTRCGSAFMSDRELHSHYYDAH